MQYATGAGLVLASLFSARRETEKEQGRKKESGNIVCSQELH